MATPISPCSNTTEAVHTAEEEDAVKIVKNEAEVGENENDDVQRDDRGEDDLEQRQRGHHHHADHPRNQY